MSATAAMRKKTGYGMPHNWFCPMSVSAVGIFVENVSPLLYQLTPPVISVLTPSVVTKASMPARATRIPLISPTSVLHAMAAIIATARLACDFESNPVQTMSESPRLDPTDRSNSPTTSGIIAPSASSAMTELDDKIVLVFANVAKVFGSAMEKAATRTSNSIGRDRLATAGKRRSISCGRLLGESLSVTALRSTCSTFISDSRWLFCFGVYESRNLGPRLCLAGKAGDDFALAHHKDPVAELREVFELFTDDDYRRPGVGGLLDEREDLRLRTDVDAVCRFVE